MTRPLRYASGSLSRRDAIGWARAFLLSSCVQLPSCSSHMDSTKEAVINPPDTAKVIRALKSVASDAKLEQPHQISVPIRAHPISSVPWIICLRSGATELSRRRPLAVFFKGNEFVSARMSAIVDGCDSQAFSDLR